MAKGMVTVRHVDEEILRKFKAKTVEKEMKMGAALTEAMRNWVEQKEEKLEPNQRNLQN
ncbi:MAG: hypothetical protein HYU39_02705 [Thaumarchaeota archaeon]|nr:hypothetical protein [Nitrososphaerota archaeon]